MTTFVRISKAEFDEALSPFGILGEGVAGGELTYDIGTGVNDVVVRIYSSISLLDGVTRKKGADAIRVVLLDLVAGKPFGKDVRTHRTDGWDRRLRVKVEGLLSRVKEESPIWCRSCGSMMVKREGRHGEFYGCVSFPKCRQTVSVRDFDSYVKGLPPERPGRPVEEKVERPKPSPAVDSAEAGIPFDNPFNKAPVRAEPSPGAVSTPPGIVRQRRPAPEPPPAPSEEERPEMVLEREGGPLPENVVGTDVNLRGPFILTSRLAPLIYPFEALNPVQDVVHKYRHDGENMVIAAATSAGKTVCAEMLMVDAVEDGDKAIFLSPLKAVSQEKHDDWHDKGHYFSTKRVSIVTGDYSLTQERVEELNRADIIVMTSEMLDSRTRRMKAEKNVWLCDARVLVVDEFHLLTMEQRGAALESALMRFTRQNPECRIVALSATMSNVPELAAWLSKLNGKPTRIIQTDWRPCQLDVHFIQYNHFTGRGAYQENELQKALAAVRLVDEYSDDKFIIFVHTKRAGRAILGMLRERDVKTEFHSADLELRERLRVEGAFRSQEPGSLRVLVATSTLAWGINMPARRVVVVGLTRGMNDVHPIDIKQEAGRAGRIGLDDRGDSYVIIPDDYPEAHAKYVLNIPPVESQIKDMLPFHVISEIESGEVFDAETLRVWFNRSLAAHQGEEMTAYDAAGLISTLKRIGAIWEEDGRYKATNLGRIAAWLYFSPFDVAGWNKNWNMAFISAERPDDVTISWAIASVECFANFVPQEISNEVAHFASEVRSRGFNLRGDSELYGYAAYSLLQGMADKSGAAMYARGMALDSERFFQVFKLLDKMVGKWGAADFFDGLEIRFKYGVPWAAVELCRVPGIGKKRVGRLMKAGINSIEEFTQNANIAKALLGPGVFKKASDFILKRGVT